MINSKKKKKTMLHHGNDILLAATGCVATINTNDLASDVGSCRKAQKRHH